MPAAFERTVAAKAKAAGRRPRLSCAADLAAVPLPVTDETGDQEGP